jgi:hypothetical protein
MVAKTIATPITLERLPGMSLQQAREAIAVRAVADGHYVFAREVLAGCWDHRNDVQAAMAGYPLRPIPQ